MSDTESLSSILSGSSPFVSSAPPSDPAPAATDVKPAATAPAPSEPAAPPATSATSAEQAEPAKSEPVRDEHGRFTKSEPKPDNTVPVGALQDERRKRQELEARLKELEIAKPKTDFFENPDQAFSERAREVAAPLQEKLFKLSMRVAAKEHADFDEAADAFRNALDADPRLFAQWQAADDPGEFVYTVGMQIRELSEVGGDFRKYREKVTATAKAEADDLRKQVAALTAEVETLKKGKAALDAVPESLNSQSARTPRLEDADPDDLKTLVRFGNHKR